MNKESLKKWIMFFCNIRLLFCFGIAWLVTNGWAYILFGIGTYLEIHWMLVVSGTYLTFIWLPLSPEKIVTIAIAMALLRLLFPYDEKTIAVLKDLHLRLKTKKKAHTRRQRKKQKREIDPHTMIP